MRASASSAATVEAWITAPRRVVSSFAATAAASLAARATVRMVPSTGWPTAEYAASVARSIASANTAADRSSGPARPSRRSSAPISWLRITPELPRAPSSAPRL